MIALSLAQARLSNHDLGAPNLPASVLVTSAEPCMICLGAVIWSGVRGLLCAARSSDVEALGFAEGPRRTDWIDQLQQRGIAVRTDLLRDETCTLRHNHCASGGPIYNARRGSSN